MFVRGCEGGMQNVALNPEEHPEEKLHGKYSGISTGA